MVSGSTIGLLKDQSRVIQIGCERKWRSEQDCNSNFYLFCRAEQSSHYPQHFGSEISRLSTRQDAWNRLGWFALNRRNSTSMRSTNRSTTLSIIDTADAASLSPSFSHNSGATQVQNSASKTSKAIQRWGSLKGEGMARINLEDQFWLDVMAVIEKVPDRDRVIGNAVRFFRYAQEEHKQGKLISESDFEAHGFLPELIPFFAKRVSGGIQAKGAEKHFDWLSKKVEAGRRGGKASGASRSRKSLGSKQTKQTAAKPSKPKQAEPSPSPSPSPSCSDSSYYPSGNTPSKARTFIAAYCEKFKARWDHNPEITKKDSGIAKRVAENLSEEKIGLYLDAYFSMPDSWLVKTKHPVAVFESKLNEIVVYAKSGRFTTMREARNADQAATTMSQLERIRRGEL